jgi:predicted nucleic acid-binding protein
MNLVVDASVAVRWYLPEDGAEEAESILLSESSLIAPELVIAEIGNAVWKRVRKGEVPRGEAVNIVDRALTAFTSLIPLSELAVSAMALSTKLNHPIYDCFYLALALRETAPLVTADRRLHAIQDQAGVSVQLLPAGT